MKLAFIPCPFRGAEYTLTPKNSLTKSTCGDASNPAQAAEWGSKGSRKFRQERNTKCVAQQKRLRLGCRRRGVVMKYLRLALLLAMVPFAVMLGGSQGWRYCWREIWR